MADTGELKARVAELEAELAELERDRDYHRGDSDRYLERLQRLERAVDRMGADLGLTSLRPWTMSSRL